MSIYRILATLNAIALAGVIYINYLAVNLPINGKSTGELSDNLPNYFVPAGFTFSIWGIIYLFLIGSTIFSFVKSNTKERTTNHFLSRISFLFVFNCVANISWIYLWHYEKVTLSFFMMLIILVTLILIYERLRIGLLPVRSSIKWLVHIPFSLYLGWITVATIANGTGALVHWNWDGFGISGKVWAVIMIVIATLVGLRVFQERKDYAYIAVLCWAFFGIFSKRNDLSGIRDIVAMAALGGIAILLSSMIGGLIVKRKA